MKVSIELVVSTRHVYTDIKMINPATHHIPMDNEENLGKCYTSKIQNQPNDPCRTVVRLVEYYCSTQIISSCSAESMMFKKNTRIVPSKIGQWVRSEGA